MYLKLEDVATFFVLMNVKKTTTKNEFLGVTRSQTKFIFVTFAVIKAQKPSVRFLLLNKIKFFLRHHHSKGGVGWYSW